MHFHAVLATGLAILAGVQALAVPEVASSVEARAPVADAEALPVAEPVEARAPVADAEALPVAEPAEEAEEAEEAAAANLPGLNAVQSKRARAIIKRVHALHMPKRACLVAIATAQQESSIRILANTHVPESYRYPHDGAGSDHDSVGIFQQRPSWGSVKDRMDAAKSSDKFLNALKAVRGWQNMSVARAAQSVQRSAYPDAYARWVNLATRVCNAGF